MSSPVYEVYATTRLIQRPCYQRGSPYQDPAGSRTTRRSPRRKLQWYGHVFRSSGLAKTILQGTVKGGRRQGRKRKRWEDNIREWKGLEFAKSQRAVENRKKWRKLVVKSSVVPQRRLRLRDRLRYKCVYVCVYVCVCVCVYACLCTRACVGACLRVCVSMVMSPVHQVWPKTILQGTVKGGRRQGRKRKRWEDNIREWTGLEFAKSQRAVQNGGKLEETCCEIICGAQRPSRFRDR